MKLFERSSTTKLGDTANNYRNTATNHEEHANKLFGNTALNYENSHKL